MSKEKLDELKDRITHHFKNELEIMKDILTYLSESESKELNKFMLNQPYVKEIKNILVRYNECNVIQLEKDYDGVASRLQSYFLYKK